MREEESNQMNMEMDMELEDEDSENLWENALTGFFCISSHMSLYL